MNNLDLETLDSNACKDILHQIVSKGVVLTTNAQEMGEPSQKVQKLEAQNLAVQNSTSFGEFAVAQPKPPRHQHP